MFTGSSFVSHAIRLVDQSNNVIATGSTVTSSAGTCTVTVDDVDLTAITAVKVQMQGGFSAGTMSSGAGTFCTIT